MDGMFPAKWGQNNSAIIFLCHMAQSEALPVAAAGMANRGDSTAFPDMAAVARNVHSPFARKGNL
jgi:hypothetical protein